MSVFVDRLVEQQHAAIEAARPRFRAGMRETVKARDPRLVKMWARDYAVRPGLPWAFNNDVPYSWTQFETDSYAEAVEAVKGYLFCGAPYVTLHYYSVNGRTETVETWRAQ